MYDLKLDMIEQGSCHSQKKMLKQIAVHTMTSIWQVRLKKPVQLPKKSSHLRCHPRGSTYGCYRPAP